jgi:predicted ATPase
MIKDIHIRNFKAVKDSLGMPLQPFTAFIGNNGTGKSSILEAMQTLQLCITEDLMSGFKRWGGLEKVHNYRSKLEEPDVSDSGFRKTTEGIYFHLACIIDKEHYEYNLQLNINQTGDFYVIEFESFHHNGLPVFEGKIINEGLIVYEVMQPNSAKPMTIKINAPKTMLTFGVESIVNIEIIPPIKKLYNYISSWQFLHLNPLDMGEPVLRNRLEKNLHLDFSGRNIADYILWLKNQSPESLDNLIEKLKFVIPYLQDLQPEIIESMSEEVRLIMHEDHPKGKGIPGWLLSSGTLRIAAILSMFDNPKPPSVLFIDEIENGLDPRTIGFLLEEIRNAVQQENPMQVICTTHSPYLLDLIPLESIIVTERGENGSSFSIPSTNEALKDWREKFSPGKLYISGKL